MNGESMTLQEALQTIADEIGMVDPVLEVEVPDEEPPAGWIKVSDRLPEDGRPVLCATPDGMFILTLSEDAWFENENHWLDRDEFPTHWQPLPPLPDEER